MTYSNNINAIAGLSGGLPATPATVTAGVTNWVGGNCSNSSGSVYLYEIGRPGANVYAAPHSFGTAWPSAFPIVEARVMPKIALDFFLSVQDVP